MHDIDCVHGGGDPDWTLDDYLIDDMGERAEKTLFDYDWGMACALLEQSLRDLAARGNDCTANAGELEWEALDGAYWGPLEELAHDLRALFPGFAIDCHPGGVMSIVYQGQRWLLRFKDKAGAGNPEHVHVTGPDGKVWSWHVAGDLAINMEPLYNGYPGKALPKAGDWIQAIVYRIRRRDPNWVYGGDDPGWTLETLRDDMESNTGKVEADYDMGLACALLEQSYRNLARRDDTYAIPHLEMEWEALDGAFWGPLAELFHDLRDLLPDLEWVGARDGALTVAYQGQQWTLRFRDKPDYGDPDQLQATGPDGTVCTWATTDALAALDVNTLWGSDGKALPDADALVRRVAAFLSAA